MSKETEIEALKVENTRLACKIFVLSGLVEILRCLAVLPLEEDGEAFLSSMSERLGLVYKSIGIELHGAPHVAILTMLSEDRRRLINVGESVGRVKNMLTPGITSQCDCEQCLLCEAASRATPGLETKHAQEFFVSRFLSQDPRDTLSSAELETRIATTKLLMMHVEEYVSFLLMPPKDIQNEVASAVQSALAAMRGTTT